MRKLVAALGAALFAASAAPACAYSYRTCLGEKVKWRGNGAALRASPVSFPAGSAWRTAFDRSVLFTNANAGIFRFSGVTDSGGVGLANGENEIWGTSNPSLLVDRLGAAHVRYTCFWLFGIFSKLDEVDVALDYRAPFQFTPFEAKANINPYQGALFQMQTVAAHEFGHAAGLLHENATYNDMGDTFRHIWANGTVARAYLGENASEGLVSLYGLNAAEFQDLSVSHWKYSGAEGEYSLHKHTELLDLSGQPLPPFMVQREWGYVVNRGQALQAEFTFENNGKSTQTVAVGWMLSSNDYISKYDRMLDYGFVTLTRDRVDTRARTLVIPKDLAPGQYWLGAIVDIDGKVAVDTLRDNNATYIPIQVQ